MSTLVVLNIVMETRSELDYLDKYIKFEKLLTQNQTKDGWWTYKWSGDVQVNPHVAESVRSGRRRNKTLYSAVLNRITHNKPSLVRNGLSHMLFHLRHVNI